MDNLKDIKATINYKDTKIKQRQDTKNESIIISGAVRDANQVMAERLKANPKMTDKEYKKGFEEWYKYFYSFAGDQLPKPPVCSTCGQEMLTSSKGTLYCPGYFDPKNKAHHPEPDQATKSFQEELSNIN